MKEKLINNKVMIMTLITISLVLMINYRYLFTQFDAQQMTVYLSFLMMIMIVAFAILANAAYYAAKTQSNTNYVAISLGSFYVIGNYVIALLFILMSGVSYLEEIVYFMDIGHLLFALGVFMPLLKKPYLNKILSSPLKMAGVQGFLLFIEMLIYQIASRLEITYLFNSYILNSLGVIICLILLIEMLSGNRSAIGITKRVALLLFFMHIYLTFTSINLAHIINANLILIAMVIHMFYQLNQQNFILPEESKRKLLEQFNIYSTNLKKVIDKKTFEVSEVNLQIMEELDYAREIQQSLLPSKKYTYQDVSFLSGYFPCERLSGDFYDLFRIDEDHIALYYLDVAGHGISAALMTMLSSNFLRATDQSLKRLWETRPDRTLRHFYEHFNRLNIPDEMHLVIFYATYNLKTKELMYCSGGMNCAPILVRQDGRMSLLEDSKGFPICRMGNLYTPTFMSAGVNLRKGDRIIFYTDGLIDKEKNNIYDMRDLQAEMKSAKKLTGKELNDKIFEKIKPFKDSLNDDITYIIMDI